MTTPLSLLMSRQSVRATTLRSPAPSPPQLEMILSAGVRVPDHGRLAPWRFVRIEGDARADLGEIVAAIFRSAHADATPPQLDVERRRFLRAPLVVAVVSCVRDHTKIREWDQVLSAGACCLNILNAAHALGFGAQWLTEWYAYDAGFCRRFGLVDKERIAGFIHMGSPAERPADRPRPVVADLLQDWKPDRAPE